MANTLYVAVYTAATSGVTWARADIANGRNGFSASGYVDSLVDASIITADGDETTAAITGLSSGTAYKLWAIVDDGSTSSNGGTPQASGMFVHLDHTESASAADAQSAVGAFARAVAESASAADSQAAVHAMAAATTESASAADAQTDLAVLVAVLSESGSAGDEVSATAAGYDVSVTEAASASDAVAAIGSMVAAVSEALSAAEALTVTAVYGAAQAEDVDAEDVVDWGGAFYSVEVAEAGSLQDAVAAAMVALAGMSEAGNADDVPTVILSAGVGVLEAGAAADAVASAMQIFSLLTEPASAVDTVAVLADGTIEADIEEGATAMDEYVAVLIDGFLVITAPPRRVLTAGALRPANLSAGRGR